MQVTITSDTQKTTAQAKAIMKGQDVTGQALLTEYQIDDAFYVHLRLEVQSENGALAAGKHAVHIHEKAACDCEGFKCAGGHFDPGPNGNSDPDANHGYHSGDLPSITIDANGHGVLEAITTRVTLSYGPVSLLSPESAPEGTSLMIHGNHDPYTPGETGTGHSGGPRLVCGTIEAM